MPTDVAKVVSAGAEQREPPWLEDDLALSEHRALEPAPALAANRQQHQRQLAEGAEPRDRRADDLALLTGLFVVAVAWVGLLAYLVYRLLPF